MVYYCTKWMVSVSAVKGKQVRRKRDWNRLKSYTCFAVFWAVFFLDRSKQNRCLSESCTNSKHGTIASCVYILIGFMCTMCKYIHTRPRSESPMQLRIGHQFWQRKRFLNAIKKRTNHNYNNRIASVHTHRHISKLQNASERKLWRCIQRV